MMVIIYQFVICYLSLLIVVICYLSLLIYLLFESSDSNGKIRISLDNKAHSVPMYTVVVSPNLEFCVFAFNWTVLDCNTIYKGHKCSVKYLNIAELLEKLENFGL